MGIADIVPQLDQCCCGCQLRTGSKFVGWCGVIFGTLAFIFYLFLGIGVSAINDKSQTQLTPEQVQAVRITFIFVAVLSILRALFAVLLLIGVYKEKISYYKPWIIYSTVALVLDIILIIAMLIQHDEAPKIIGSLIGTCVYCYFILVVYSDYRQQKERAGVH